MLRAYRIHYRDLPESLSAEPDARIHETIIVVDGREDLATRYVHTTIRHAEIVSVELLGPACLDDSALAADLFVQLIQRENDTFRRRIAVDDLASPRVE